MDCLQTFTVNGEIARDLMFEHNTCFDFYPAVPFKTLGKAYAVAQPGETILLRGGVYREVLKPQWSEIDFRGQISLKNLSDS